MKSFSKITLTALVLAFAIASAAEAKPKPAAGKKGKPVEIPEVTVTGCVTKGSGSFCWNLKAEDGTNYSFAGQPAVEGKCYTVTGKETMGACRTGTQLGVTGFAAAKYDCCTQPPPAKTVPAGAEPAEAPAKP